jgi:hypothetical protein
MTLTLAPDRTVPIGALARVGPERSVRVPPLVLTVARAAEGPATRAAAVGPTRSDARATVGPAPSSVAAGTASGAAEEPGAGSAEAFVEIGKIARMARSAVARRCRAVVTLASVRRTGDIRLFDGIANGERYLSLL